MTRKQIIDKVKLLLEDVTPFDDGLVVLNSEVKPIASYIEGSIQTELDNLLMICPLHLTTPEEIKTSLTKTLSDGRYIGTLPLPDDFVRLHTLKMEGWIKPIHNAISINNPVYELQFNKFTRGGDAKPIVVLNSGKLELYTIKSEDENIEIGLFVKRIDATEGVELHEKLYDPLCAMIASSVCAVFGDKQTEYFAAMANNLLKKEL